MIYTIIALDFQEGLSRQDASSHIARAVRSVHPTLKSGEIIQYPVADGGEGTMELLVTERLGSFLEVDVKDAAGVDAIVPIGFLGDDGGLAVISMASVARTDAIGVGSGTTYGIGELIQDSLDERAFSILLGHEEPLANDAGLGIAAALGVKFCDAEDQMLDLSHPQSELLAKIHRIDATGRSFELLSARLHIARSANVRSVMPEKKLLTQLNRVAKLAQKAGGAEINLEKLALSTSLVEFGLALFFNSEVKEGSQLVLEASMVLEKIATANEARFCIIADSAEQLLSPSRPAAVAMLLESPRKTSEVTILLRQEATDAERLSLANKIPNFRSVFSLAQAPLFTAPLRPDSGREEIRRDQTMRIEKLIPQLLPVMRSSETLKA